MNDNNDIERIFTMAEGLADVKKKELDKLPFHINVIESAARGKLRETAHSMILADLLRHPQIQASFLKWAFNLDVAGGTLKVKTEFGSSESHIDIALHDKEHFVIIENKANWAQEQHSQIYRYVEEIAHKDKRYAYEQIYVLYLNPMNQEEPSSYSLTKDGFDVRQLLKERFVIWSFAHDIVEWLQSLNNMEEPFIQSAVHQYIDYLEHYYGTSKEFLPMENAMETYLKENLGITNETPDIAVLSMLKEKSKKAADLLKSINGLRQEYSKQWLLNTTKLLAQKFNLPSIDTFNNNGAVEFKDSRSDFPKGGVLITAKCGYSICVLIEYGLSEEKVNYGVRMNEKDAHYKDVKEIITPVMTYDSISPESGLWWPGIKRTSYKNAEERASTLIQAILDSEL